MILKLLFALVFVVPLGILIGFAVLHQRWSKVLLLFAGIALVTTFSLLKESREAWLPIVPLALVLQFVLMLGAIFLGLALKMASVVWWGKTDVPAIAPAPAIHWPNLIFYSALAFFLPILFAYHGAFARAEGKPLFIGIALVIATAIVSFVALLRSKSYVFAATAASCAVSLTALVLYAYSTGATVQQAARLLAQGKPYCIQSGNTVVQDIWDLNVLNLRENSQSTFYLGYHALLVARENGVNRFYNWSYYSGQFLPTESTYTRLICTPQITP